MKKILVTTLVVSALGISAFAQGSVTFSAAKDTLKYTLDGTTIASVPKGNPASIDGKTFKLALYAAPQGNTLSFNGIFPDFSKNGWTIMETAALSTVAPFAGTMSGTVNIPAKNAANANLAGEFGGGNVQLTVVAWTGDAATFEAALLEGKGLAGWSGDARFANVGAQQWVQGTGYNGKDLVNPPGSTPVVAGANGFQGLVLAPIPEPSTFALAGLGAAALLIFRRRK